MKKPMLALLAAFACAVLAPQGVRAADPPDLKETLKWLARYLNEEAGGQYGPDLPADAPSGATGPRFSASYEWIDKDWTSPDEATADWQFTFTDRASDKTTQLTVSVKLTGLDLGKLSVAANRLKGGGYLLRIPVNEAVTVMRDGAAVKTSTVSVMFPTEEAAKKANRALRRAAMLAGAVDVADPFVTDPPKEPIVSRPDPPATPPPPPADDGKAARRAELDVQIESAAQAVTDDEQKLNDLNGKVVAAKVVVVAADAAYQKAEPGSLDELLTGAALATAQGVLDDLLSQKDGVESDLQADRDRLNQLKKERARLGN